MTGGGVGVILSYMDLQSPPPPPPIADWAWEGPICQGVRLDHI